MPQKSGSLVLEKPLSAIMFAIPMQIVVTNKLNSKNHESLKVLSKNANTDDIHRFTRFAQSFTEPGDK